MHDWMTSRHEGCVSTMLTDKRLKYCTAGAPLQGSGATKWTMQADKHRVSGVFRLDACGWTSPPCSRRRATQGGDTRGLYSFTVSKDDCIFVFVIPAKDEHAMRVPSGK